MPVPSLRRLAPWLGLAAFLMAASASRASAQESVGWGGGALRGPTPAWRLDATVSVGFGSFEAPIVSYSRSIAALTGELRLVGREGHGAMLRGVTAGNVWGAGHGAEIDYVLRTRLEGDDRRGVGLDALMGLSAGLVAHDEATVPSGPVIGPNWGVTIDFRWEWLVVTAGLQYRMLLPMTLPSDASRPTSAEHVLTATVGLGFGAVG